MKCFFHNDSDATAVCQDCGRCLCSECASGHSRAICVGCLVRRNASSRRRIYINLATLVIIFSASVFILHGLKVSRTLVLDYPMSWKVALCACFTCLGWKFLSNRQGCFFIGGGLFWIFYLYFKLAFSFLVGLVVGPVRVFRMLGELLSLHRSNAEIQTALKGGI